MKTKHTPGPWVAQNWVSDGVIEYPERIAAAGWPKGRTVAKIILDKKDSFGGSLEYQEGELHANARLIAAAPELLELLNSIVENASKANVPCEYYIHESLLNEAKTLIAKATGEKEEVR